jgi:Putative Phosphatase.
MKPTLALIYDFDKTLCAKDMQEYGFISNVSMTSEEFWNKANKLTKENKMDPVLSYMWLMIERSNAIKQPIQRRDFVSLGKDLKLFPGVETWFDRIAEYGEKQGVEIEHYIISSGLREIIEGSIIFEKFKEVFACEFLYDESGMACWAKNVVNYTTKTQFLFRINKGILDISKNDELNRYTPEEKRPIPFRNMIYIGDGMTDVPCMKLVKFSGGHSIAVYQDGTKEKTDILLAENRVDFTAPADYSKGSELEMLVTKIIRNAESI